METEEGPPPSYDVAIAQVGISPPYEGFGVAPTPHTDQTNEGHDVNITFSNTG